MLAPHEVLVSFAIRLFLLFSFAALCDGCSLYERAGSYGQVLSPNRVLMLGRAIFPAAVCNFLTVSFKLIISTCTRPFAAYSQTHFSGGTTPKLPLPMGIQAPIQYIVPGAYPSTQPEWQLSSWLCLVSDTDANTERPLYILLYIMRTFLQNTTSCISLCDFFMEDKVFYYFHRRLRISHNYRL